MAAVFLSNEITGGADGCVRAEKAWRSNPLSPASSGSIVSDEAPGVIADVRRIDAWMGTARTGDMFTYATRPFLPASSPGAKRMRDLSSRGLVKLTQARCAPGVSLFYYRATRTSAPTPLERPVRPRLTATVIDAEAALVDALLPVLERAAKFGRPCPTDKQLAQKSGLAPEQIGAAMQALVLANLIRVHQAPRPTLRRVIIVATGAQTGLAV